MEPAIQVRLLSLFPSPLGSLDRQRSRLKKEREKKADSSEMQKLQRGDLLFLTMPLSSPLKHGDITVYKVPGTAIPIVHRVIEAHLLYALSPLSLSLCS